MKKIRSTGITGAQGVNLIERVVLDMGSLWHPTGGLEAGVDGFIEFRDPATEEVQNLQLPVQSKATSTGFSSETPTGFTYTCKPEDLEYWLQGNLPLVIVVSRPGSNEGYWKEIKSYFKDPRLRETRKIVFDKQQDRFDAAARARLIACATNGRGGFYLAPIPKRETLYSNLLPITRMPERLYHGLTELGSAYAIREMLKEVGGQAGFEWVFCAGKSVLSVHDLSGGPWRSVCDQGTVEEFDTSEWSQSLDDDRLNPFKDLLSKCLADRLYPLGVRFDRSADHYFFLPGRNSIQRELQYQSFKNRTKATVVQGYPQLNDASVMGYYRHHAFEGRFRQYAGEWFLQIDPTFRFTHDGRAIYRFSEERLSGIRKLQKNPGVIGQIVMWASLLTDPETENLFEKNYPYLGFGRLAQFDSSVGIDDKAWVSSDEDPETEAAVEQAMEFFDLFSGDDP